jgi:hypothetical protein
MLRDGPGKEVSKCHCWVSARSLEEKRLAANGAPDTLHSYEQFESFGYK